MHLSFLFYFQVILLPKSNISFYNSAILFYTSIFSIYFIFKSYLLLQKKYLMKKTQITTLLLFVVLTVTNNLLAQSPSQNLRGTVNDKESLSNIPFAILKLVNSDTTLNTKADENGKFIFNNVLPGRYELSVSFTGYNNVTIPNVIVTTGKEVVLELMMEESINQIEVVSITGTKKHETVNELTSVSARSFSMEEVTRFAGGRQDPSRMAANFAGVSSPDDSRNDIVVRGNSPAGVLWRIEGLNIPNPNHFSTIGTTGGPVSALNTNILKNSDFFTSAFPSEYGNATAGVFDLGFRSGNTEKREHTFQIGALTGIEAMTEGPLNKSKGSSYLIAYRYSFVGVAQKLGIPVGTAATPFYQDVSFKLNGAYNKYGKFVLFGIGGASNIDFKHDKIDSTDLFANPTHDSYFTSKIGLVGLSHFIRINNKSYIKSILGATYSSSDYNEDTINASSNTITRIIENQTKQIRYSLNSSYNSKVSSKLFLKIGLIDEVMNLNLFYRGRFETVDWQQYWDYKDYTNLLQTYAHLKYTPSDKLTFNLGLHNQYLFLNQSNSLEPRAGVNYNISQKSKLSFGYGLHSQMQPIDVYFYRTNNTNGSINQSNLDLGFTKSHQFVLGYEFFPNKNWRIKTETYYQYLFNIPVNLTNSSYSMLNAGASFFPNDQVNLINNGSGENYGLELTVEKFFSKGYYILATGSVYESNYKGSDGVQRNTGFNGKYVYNILTGKEFKIGAEKRNALTIDFKMTHAGGRYFTPVDLVASQLVNAQVLKGDDYAFSQRNPSFFRVDIKFGLTLNSTKHKLAQGFYLDIQNVMNYKNVFAQRYNPVTNSINTAYQIGFFPNFVYKLQF